MHRSGTRRRVSRPALAAFAALSGAAMPLLLAAPAVGAEPYASVVIGDEVVVARDSRVYAHGSSPGGSSLRRGAPTPLPPKQASAFAEVPAVEATDPLRAAQWAFDQVAFEGSWSASDGTGVVVAVVDTGVQATHEDLAGSVLTGWDFTVSDPAGRAGGNTDPRGHGTHVAGIIAAHRNNRLGGTGVAPGAKILPVRALDKDGMGWASDIARGIVWAADHGADIINLSLGGTDGAEFYTEAVRYARSRGALVVAAAGNEAEYGNPVVYPAAVPEAMAVAAVDADGRRALFSSSGYWVDIAAPGTGILAPCPVGSLTCPSSGSGYAQRSGTSMAAPHVAGTAALVLGSDPSLTPAQVEATLLSTADDIGAPGRDPEFGNGLIDPLESLSGFARGDGAGYWVVSRDGRVAAVGSAPVLGGVPGSGSAIVASAATPSGQGYWIVAADGAVHARGDAPHLGAMAGKPLNAPIVGMAATTSGQGYWLLGADGGIFAFGDAPFFGSTGAMVLNQPVVDMAPTSTGRGYWMVAEDGGVFTFGDARFAGSTGSMVLNRPVTSLAPAGTGQGYWLVAADGGIFAFGVPFWGSLPGRADAAGVEGSRIRVVPGGAGYYILGADGQVFAFGAAQALGALPAGYRAGFDAVDLVLSRAA